ncbi:hypothetical protein B0T18DRAFT_430734 [Schizothecium vesticola]|uniref:Phosphate transporter n=1 Tax=Schizothecium vesticola TaxID=314040 RepID=A0AA40K2J1_9PEZI|nr:hypothetical protein B0T18DRAFT_430734 [Schizothecium vesticola]
MELGTNPHYENRIEHLWAYPQVVSAIMMSLSHGSNGVADAVGPWAAVYQTYQTGEVGFKSAAPVWILAFSPTRGYAMELGAAIKVLLASRLGLPMSATQTITGAVLGVSLMNLDLGATNWR